MFATESLVFKTADKTLSEHGAGGFAKQILVLSAADGGKAFIQKVLGAANLDLAADAIYMEADDQIPVNCFSGLPDTPAFVLVFGLSPQQIGLSVQLSAYQPVQIRNTTWLFADATQVLEPNKDKKGQLWAALKALFLSHG